MKPAMSGGYEDIGEPGEAGIQDETGIEDASPGQPELREGYNQHRERTRWAIAEEGAKEEAFFW